MLIANMYDPELPNGDSAEENIMFYNLKDLYDEIRRIVFDTNVVVSKLKTKKAGKETTGAIHLAESLNEALKISLQSCGWAPLQSPGSSAPQSLIDWYKSIPSGRSYGTERFGIGLEVQFGNNYQFNEDIKRLTEAYFAGYIVAGISIVPSDKLAKHKADRGCFFSDAKSKLERYNETLASAQARRFAPIVIIAIEQDEYNDDPHGYFEITPVIVKRNEKSNVIETTPTCMITNGEHRVIVDRRNNGCPSTNGNPST